MSQIKPSTESTAPRALTVWLGALIVLVMLVAYVIVYVLVSRQEILADNIQWIRTVVARWLP